MERIYLGRGLGEIGVSNLMADPCQFDVRHVSSSQRPLADLIQKIAA
jgi:hypothetical protein